MLVITLPSGVKNCPKATIQTSKVTIVRTPEG